MIRKGRGVGAAVATLLFFVAAIAAAGGGCAAFGAGAAGTSIQVRGSDTIVNLAQAWAADFMEENPQASVAVTGGGSGVGIESLLNGTADIATASREIKESEVAQAVRSGVEPVEFTVALDGIAVVVHPSNPIGQLTIDQLSAIFTERTTNWKELGWRDAPIVVLSRESNSGTHAFFKEEVVRRGDPESMAQFGPGVLLMPSSQGIADEVSKNPNAIGYYGIGYLSPQQKPIAIAAEAGERAVPPALETVLDGDYPLARPLYLYTNGRPAGVTAEFIRFALSDEGQDVVEEIGFVPVKGTSIDDGRPMSVE